MLPPPAASLALAGLIVVGAAALALLVSHRLGRDRDRVR
jgi:hypothetical protein